MKSAEIVRNLRRLKIQTGGIQCLGCGYEHDCSIHGCCIMREAADLIEQQAAKIEELEEKIPRWIPVTERLPEDRSDVLVVAYWHERWGVYMGWCAPERAEWSVHIGTGDRNDIAVTHGMPLPGAPKEENDG